MAVLPRIAVVGAGAMGTLHARVIAQSSRVELAYIIEPDATRGAEVAERYGATWRPDFDAVSYVDAAVVASSTETHYDIGREVIERSLPLLMEKPLAQRLSETEELVALSGRAGVPLMCGLLERYNPAIMTAMSVVEEPLHLTAVRHSPYDPRIRTGVSSDLLIHDVDIVLRIAGADPTSVRGSFGFLHPNSMDGSEDVAEVVLGFAGGAVANVSASRISQRKVRWLTIAEANRLVEVDLLRHLVTIYRHVLNEASPDGLSYKQQTIIEIPTLVSSREPLAVQLDRFVDLLTGDADIDEERASILPAHRAVDHVREDAARSLS
jgi:predicted dehydrogenase